ncbi:hypothetical protein [Kitasatospora sp. NPDC101183]|uniref:lectin-like domain-containing protein n=1 Tax=Kitasatospora sp. NPDC101183 TaxID=3364100 RepID=UPI003803A402
MAAPVREASTTDPVTFPIHEPFTGGTTVNPNWVLRGNAQLTAGPNGSLRLTSDENNKAGTALLDQPFSSTNDVSIEFDYACEGTDSGNFGDGFCLYLIDGSKTTDTGAYGAALGYSSMGIPQSSAKPGVTAGYVGVGFDNYGNYSDDLAGPNGPGRRPDWLAVRGSGDRNTGFRWLKGEHVSGGFKATWAQEAHVQINIIDEKLTVRHRRGGDVTLVIDEFDLANASNQVPMPATFKLGLSASTGGARAAHSIRNLHVALPADMPVRMDGPKEVKAGAKVSYTIAVSNNGPNDVPDAEVTGTIPAELTGVTVTCEPKGGATCGGSSTGGGLHQFLDLPKGGSALITVTGTVSSTAGGGTLACTAEVKSPTRANTSAHPSDRLDVKVLPKPPVPVGGQVPADDSTWSQGGDSRIVFVTVDTSAANFEKTPVYVASVAGQKFVANLGAPGIYGTSNKHFSVGLRWTDQADLSVADAKANGFRLHWIACPQDAEGVASGQTSPDSWRQAQDDPRVVLVDISTSHAGFTETPVHVASVVGDKLTANLSTVAILDRSRDGFTVGIRLSDQSDLSPGTAKANGFRINWIACPAGLAGLVSGRTDPAAWTQGEDTGILFTKATAGQANLPQSPAFVASVAGGAKVVELGCPGLYGATKAGFTAGVRRSDQAVLPPKFAQDNGIAVDWIACPTPSA